MVTLDLQKEYYSQLPLFQRTVTNVIEAFKLFLAEKGIQYLSVSGRVKTLDSLIDKINRKRYQDPFSEIEDFVGMRVIVFYIKDIPKIQEIIDTEFDLQESINKIDELQSNEFGYRSKHSIVKIKREWLSAPNYRGLENIKIEVQVRTTLMHAWAEISHKLSYKSENQLPTKDLERQLYRLSANFESSDEMLQSFKDGVESYRDEIKLSVEIDKNSIKNYELNYDSLTALLDHYLPGFPNNSKTTLSALDRMLNRKNSIEQTEELLIKVRPVAQELNNSVFPSLQRRLTRGTILSYADDIFNSYADGILYTESRKAIVEAFRNKSKS